MSGQRPPSMLARCWNCGRLPGGRLWGEGQHWRMCSSFWLQVSQIDILNSSEFRVSLRHSHGIHMLSINHTVLTFSSLNLESLILMA